MFMYMRLLGYPAERISILTTYNGQKHLIRDVINQRCANNPFFGQPNKVRPADCYLICVWHTLHLARRMQILCVCECVWWVMLLSSAQSVSSVQHSFFCMACSCKQAERCWTWAWWAESLTKDCKSLLLCFGWSFAKSMSELVKQSKLYLEQILSAG